jgi:hypothetical protein
MTEEKFERRSNTDEHKIGFQAECIRCHRFLSEEPEYGCRIWRTDTMAGLVFDYFCIGCYLQMSQQSAVKPVEQGAFIHPPPGMVSRYFEVHTDKWGHICSCRFGKARSCGMFTDKLWTADSYRYDIFKHKDNCQYALRWHNGGGDGWLIAEDKASHNERNLLAMISEMPDEAQRWDACHFLWEAVGKTVALVARQVADGYSKAFLEKRLKKRKRNGEYVVEIEQTKPVTADTKYK